LVYQAGVWEGIDFDRLDVDIIGSDAFFDKYWSESTVKSMIRSYKSSKKLVYITEFGSATFKGAKVTGSDAWRFSGSYDENEQLESNENYLKIWSELQVDGCFLYTFYEPIQPWRTEAQSFGIVRDAKGKSRLSRKKAYWLYKSYKHS
jgi:hypothetical protein